MLQAKTSWLPRRGICQFSLPETPWPPLQMNNKMVKKGGRSHTKRLGTHLHLSIPQCSPMGTTACSNTYFDTSPQAKFHSGIITAQMSYHRPVWILPCPILENLRNNSFSWDPVLGMVLPLRLLQFPPDHGAGPCLEQCLGPVRKHLFCWWFFAWCCPRQQDAARRWVTRTLN